MTYPKFSTPYWLTVAKAARDRQRRYSTGPGAAA